MVAATHPFDATVRKTQGWIAEVARALGADEHAAYRALRAVLQALRDRLTVDEACQLAAQLPQLVRGFYFEGYRPGRKPLGERTEEAFLASVRAHHGPGPLDERAAVAAVLSVLERHVSEGELADVRGMLPRGVRRLWPMAGPAVLILQPELGVPPAGLEPEAPAPPPAEAQQLSTTQGVIGAAVKDHLGERLGEVKDLVLDPATGQIQSAVLTSGGFLGLRRHEFPVPWRLLHWRDDRSFQLLLRGQGSIPPQPSQPAGAPRSRPDPWRPANLERAATGRVNDAFRARLG